MRCDHAFSMAAMRSPTLRLPRSSPPLSTRPAMVRGVPRGRGPPSSLAARSQLEMFQADDFVLDRSLGKVGFMLAADPSPARSEDALDLSKLASQEVVTGGVTAQMYTGRIQRGPRMNTRCLLKAYPPRGVENGVAADMMAANEFAQHASLQPPEVEELSPFVAKLLGGFVTSAGEQWLVFRDDGALTAAAYCAEAAAAGAAGRSVGEGDFTRGPISLRRSFLLSILRRALSGLEFMHSRDVLHCAVGPSSIFLSTAEEREARYVRVKLGGLAFAVDASDRALAEKSPTYDIAKDLWLQAARAGATAPADRREYGKAEDVFQAGLLVATLCMLPLCAPGSITEASLHKLLETTFRGDLPAMREYCTAEPQWEEAVALLDARDGAGWDLLGRMLAPDYRQRPTISEVLDAPFLNMA